MIVIIRPTQTWRTFLRNQAFTIETIGLGEAGRRNNEAREQQAARNASACTELWGAHVRHQHSAQSFAAAAAAPATRAASCKNSFCNFHIAIGDKKTHVANLITRTADSSIGGAILR
jgi:hypothetical protein